MKIKITFAAILLALGLCLPAGQGLAEGVGRVISITPGAFAERGGEVVPLALKSPVHAADVLTTDATGRVHILFDDDSSVSLMPKTRLALTAVVPQGGSPEFKASLGEGMARFITGRIVEHNPEGFSVMTPESTIGIRGTIFAVQRDSLAETTSVFVLNTARQVFVNNISVPGDHKITLPGGRVLPMTPGDIKAVNMAVAVRGGAAAEKAATGRERQTGPADLPALALLDRPDLPAGSGSLSSSLLQTLEGDGKTLADSVTGSSSAGGAVTVTGSISGTGYHMGTTISGVDGTFSITADLSSGNVSSASISGSNGAGTNFGLSGNSGRLTGSGFNVGNMSGNCTINGASSSPNGAHGYMSGSVSISGPSIGVDGRFGVNGDMPGTVKGTVTGSN